jgi:hypothetical protein
MINTNYFESPIGNPLVNKPSELSNAPLPRRLRALRKVMGYEHANTFAQALGEKPAAYGMVEAGSGGLSTKMMLKISKLCPDVTWEYLQLGNDRFLTVDMRKRLHSAEAEVTAEAKAKTTPSRGPARRPSSTR